MKHKIVFFGSGWFVLPVIEKLIPFGLDLVITNDKNPKSKLVKICNENNIQTIIASSSKELLNHQSSIINHHVAVLASYGAFIPDSIINIFPEGIINIHPSLLPKYKGPSPVQYQLLNGETTVGVTLIKLDSEIDHGPILSQRPYQLQGNETTEDLLSILFEIGAELVVEQVERLERGEKLIETPQDHAAESWSYKIEKENGKIDPYNPQPTTYNLNNMIRAFYPWPGVWFRYTPDVIPDAPALSEAERDQGSLSSSHSEQSEESRNSSHSRPDRESSSVNSGEITQPNKRHPELVSGSSKLSGKLIKLLPENRIQVEGKKDMSYKDFINGYGEEGSELLKKLGLL